MTKKLYSDDWMAVRWSEWLSLNPEDDQLRDIATDPGLYRVRHRNRDGLEYIGQTGRSVRGRVGALARNVYAKKMPFRDPHTAAPCLWAIRDQYGPSFEVSTAIPPFASDDQIRKAFEEALIATARRVMGESPIANFGRIIPGYAQSSYRSSGYVGGPLGEGETEPNAEVGREPLSWENSENVTAADWMGLDWAGPYRLADRLSSALPEAGVYRIWYQGNAPPLAYIGETSAFTGRLRSHEQTFGSEALFSVASPAGMDARHKRTEVETDLIGAHYLATEQSPTAQFGN